MKKRMLIGLPLLLICMFAVTACFTFKPVGETASVSSQTGVESSGVLDVETDVEVIAPVQSSEPDRLEPVTVRFKAVGDNLIHSSIYEQAHARANGNGYDYRYAYENVASILGDADISSINQESLIAPVYEPSTYPCFNASPELGDLMLEYGFDVFNLANNHCLDKGEKGLLSSKDYWAERPQALTTGVYRNEEDYLKIPTMEANGVIFSFIGITESTNGLSLPKGSEAVVLLADEEERIKARVEEAKALSDVVVVNIHWGNEYTFVPTDRQRAMAEKLAEWGVMVIIGHHPHVIQPVEYLNRPDGGKTLVAYSLGNFISAQDRGARMIGGLLDFDITKNPETGAASITRSSFLPLVTHYETGFRNIRLYALSDYTEELADSHGVRAYSPEFSLEYISKTVADVIDSQFLSN